MSDTIKSNMNIEGTRNERVGILIASYIIGFITAYIAFGVVQLEDSMKFAEIPSQNMASVITARTGDVTVDTFIAIDKEGLILVRNNKRTLLSAKGTSEGFLQEGEHVAISDYALSEDKSHVYFCELPSEESESCRPYIYSVDEETVYPVTIDGERVAFEAKGHEVSWSKDGELLID